MPTYDYKCDACGHEFETYQSMKDDKLTKCPVCGKESLKRLIGSGSGLIFKGSGFYLTDYKNKSSETGSAKTVSSESKKSESTQAAADSVKADTKPDTKTSAETAPKQSEKKESKNKTKKE
jgi:putative FmdB family regulatory protein